MSFNDTSATQTINIGALIDATATTTANVRSLLAGSVAWAGTVVQWFADTTWTAAQITTLDTIFDTWGTVTGITFQQTTTQNDAEIILIRDNNTNGFGGYSGIPADVPTTANQTHTDGAVVVSQTGQINIHVAPGGNIGFNGTTINIFDAAGDISRGGFELILHEIGHALGLKHPHNTSTGNTLLWPGVTVVSDLGTNSLNQDLYTLMSYNLQVVPDGAGGNTLHTMATPMAYDIAAIQLLYGANTTFNSGDTTYDLATPAAALQWTSIWDTGGTDEIKYAGTNAATIDLRSATLDGTVGSGGYLSYFTFADGRTSAGFTIAGDIRNVLGDVGTEHGVIIENASGGSGNDNITGNVAGNVLRGNAGQDTLLGGGGDDSLYGGLDSDYLDGGGDNDTAYFNGKKADFVIIGTATDLTIADRMSAGLGTDHVLNVESFVFNDGTFTAAELENAAPVITSNGGDDLAVSVAENTYFVTHVVATDSDGDPLIFTLSGADAALFQIATNGDLTFRTAPDFEAPIGGDNVYDLFVTVTDTSFATDTQKITATVTDAVEIIDTNVAAVLNGTAGADTITPGDGQDTVLAGDGNDIIKATVNDGKDVYNGGNGSDTVDYSALTAGITVTLGQNGGPGSGFGIQAGEDKLISIENVIGSAGADQIRGNDVANVLQGGAGNDVLTGGGGNDNFVFRSGFGVDRITDFDDAGDDTIVFSTAVFADWTAVQNAMSASGADVVITLDAADKITLVGTTLASMTQSDFLFVP